MAINESYIMSSFHHCPHTWMVTKRETWKAVLWDDNQSRYTDLLQDDNVPRITILFLRYPVIEFFGWLKKLAPPTPCHRQWFHAIDANICCATESEPDFRRSINNNNNNNNNNNFIAIHILHEDNRSNVEKYNVWPKSTFEEVVLKAIHVKMINTYWSICNDT